MLDAFELATSFSLSVLQLRAMREHEQMIAERQSCAQAIAGHRAAATLERDARGRYLRRPPGPPIENWMLAL